MAPRYDEAPEVAPHSYFPEVHHPPPVPEVASPQHTYASPTKTTDESSTLYQGYATSPANGAPSTFTYSPSQHGTTPKTARRLCGCTVVVFVLSVIIAILSAAVVGLGAGIGVEATRANTAEANLAAMNGSATATSAAPSATASDFSNIDNGCSTDDTAVTGTTYTSSFFNSPTFKLFCNSDAPNNPLQSLFVGNFNDCLDACAAYSFYMPSDFSNNATSNNVTCAGLSFIPAWTNRTFAEDGSAPGNCYLKPGPQNTTALRTPNIGTPCHAAILQSSS
ncbi:hypothetical protein F5Y15DRAFT_205340 [Xylariaceae sp. FL0016]|nr:hypothetical protein F5Y15DRAFT_205340 [Xylariaceae sp. FL0016]